MSKLVVFTHTKSTWHRHKDPMTEILCNSRIMILYYKWKSDYTITEFYICIDCNLIGIRDEKDTECDENYVKLP